MILLRHSDMVDIVLAGDHCVAGRLDWRRRSLERDLRPACFIVDGVSKVLGTVDQTLVEHNNRRHSR